MNLANNIKPFCAYGWLSWWLTISQL